MAERAEVQLRPYPYPYKAMLAICSDLDETPDRHVYREIMRFLNTTEETAMGPGVGLEVGNTIYFDMPPGQFAYWNTDDAGRAMVRDLIRSGHIDALHSFGDLATTRAHAGRALDELLRHDCHLEVWIDHATAPTNFGADIMQGHGDEVGHEAYHADLTTKYGIRYVWRGRVTSVTGQEVPARLGGIWTPAHPIASARTLAKETAKQALARRGHPKYSLHADNRVLRKAALRDQRPVREFIRCNPHWGGVSSCDTGRGIGDVLTRSMLNRLIERNGVCILYTHLGKIDNPQVPFGPAAVAGFRRLAQAYQAGDLLVATTRRVLRYLEVRDQLSITLQERDGQLFIELCTNPGSCGQSLTDQDVNGITIYTEPGTQPKVSVDGRMLDFVRMNPPDETGRTSATIPLSPIEFPST